MNSNFPCEVFKLINYARDYSSFYKNLYKELPSSDFAFEDVPIISQDEFWHANTPDKLLALTGPTRDGVVYKSGGTTGSPKYSIFTHEEWQIFTTIFGQGMAKNGLLPGDRVGNLFYAGELYASFLFIYKSIENCGLPIVQFPLGGSASLETFCDCIEQNGMNSLAGVPSTFVNLAASSYHFSKLFSKIEKIYFGGEALFDDQREVIQAAFPNARISSIGYASVDGGHLGHADSTCFPGEHRPFKQHSILEIVDDATGEVIRECGKVGKIIYTNLCRLHMPIIRYPVGDQAMWTEYGEKFKILGRSEEGARIGPVTIVPDDIRDGISRFLLKKHNELHLMGTQLLIQRVEAKDQLTIRLVLAGLDEGKPYTELCQSVTEFIMQEKPMYQEEVRKGHIQKLEVEIFPESQVANLERNARTGKTLAVIDRRFRS